MKNKSHAASTTTLSLEHHAESASATTFIHNFPGPMEGGIPRGTKGSGFGVARTASRFLLPLVLMPSQDAGDRLVYLATSARYSANIRPYSTCGSPLTTDVQSFLGTKNVAGVYSLFFDGEIVKNLAYDTLSRNRENGILEKSWSTIEKKSLQITGCTCI